MWVGEKGYNEIIEHNWLQGQGKNDLDEIIQKIKNCSFQLSQWNRTCLRNVQKNLAKAKSNLARIQNMELDLVSKKILDQTRKNVHLWLERNEIM